MQPEAPRAHQSQQACRAWSRRARRLPLLAVLAVLLACAMSMLTPVPSAHALDLVVNSTGDEGDAGIDGACLTALNTCTLRAALEEAAGNLGPHTITFTLGGTLETLHTIAPATDYVEISVNTTIDGWSQGDSLGSANYNGPPLIAIVSSGAADAFVITNGTSHVNGLALGGFNPAIDISGGHDHTLRGLYLGVAPSLAVANATVPIASSDIGIRVQSVDTMTIGGLATGEGNVLANHAQSAVELDQVVDVKVLGNFVGTNRLGTTGLGNGAGVVITGSQDVHVGNGTSAGRNVISGNNLMSDSAGVITGISLATVIRGNYIGVGPDGATPLPNTHGVIVTFSDGTEVGGPESGHRNVISGNTDAQVFLTGDCGCGVPTRVRGNYIGLNAAGTAAVPNGANGVQIDNGIGIEVGGPNPGDGNVISGNHQDGIQILGEFSFEIAVGGNKIGTNPGGTSAIPNEGNGVSAIPHPFAPNDPGPHKTIVGSLTPGTGNLISGNKGHGVLLRQTRQETIVIHNVIGLASDGVTPIGNDRNGILIQRARRIVVNENIVARNGQAGIVSMPRGNDNLGNVLTLNSVYDNQGIGIDVTDTVNGAGVGDGVTPNDAPDVDGVQNFPVIDTATTSSVGTVVGGSLTSIPNSSYRVELFASPSCDPANHGEGKVYIGGFDVATNGSGVVPFTATLGALTPGQVVTATATNLARHTSEFSLCKTVTTAAIVVSPTGGLQTTEAGGTATFTVALATKPVADVTIGLTSNRLAEGTVSPSSLTFTPLNFDRPQTVTVTGVADTTADGNQTYAIVTAPAASTDPAYNGLNAADVAVVNLDSPTLPTVSIANAQATEGTNVEVPISFTVTLAPASTQQVSVEWRLVDGTAKALTDVLPPLPSGPVVFAPGETQKTIDFRIAGDPTPEPTETFQVTLHGARNAAIGTATATGTILDDDGPATSCSPRPNVVMTRTRTGTDQIVVSLTAGHGNLTKITFGSQAAQMQNAVIETIGPASTIQGFGVFTPPPNVTQQAFVVRRIQTNLPVMVSMVVEDGCGEWPTFIGNGTGGTPF